MRDQSIIQQFDKLGNYILNMEKAVRLDSTGKEIRLMALQSLMLKKGLITQEELTQEVGEVITKMQTAAEEAMKKQETEIIKPTTDQVQQVTNTPVDAPVTQETPQA